MAGQNLGHVNYFKSITTPVLFNDDENNEMQKSYFVEPLDDIYHLTALRKQIEYYFSEQNLYGDIFLRRKMDKDGFVPLNIIKSFNRVKAFARDNETIALAINTSYDLELKNNKVRTLHNPTKWPLPDKDLCPLMFYEDHPLDFYSLGLPKMSNEEIVIKSANDDFILPKSDVSYPMEPFVRFKAPTNLRDETPINLPDETSGISFDNSNSSEPEEKISLQSELSPANPLEQDSPNQEDSLNTLDAKSKEGSTFPVELNPKLHMRSLIERAGMGPGKSMEMNKLYKFWCYNLMKNFDETHYAAFKDFSVEDSKCGHRYGIECLFRFYSYGLENRFDPLLFDEFQKFTLMDYEQGHLYGLEKFWSFLHFKKGPKHLFIDKKLRKILEQFKSLEDFKLKGGGAHAKKSTLNPDAKEFIPN